MTAGRASMMSKPTVAAGPVVSDSFNRADSATTMGNADSGQTWVPNSGVWGIDTNRAYPISGQQGSTVIESTLADCTIQGTIAVVGNGGLCWRSTDDSNYFLLVTDVGQAYRRQAGGFTFLGTGGTWIDGDVMTVVLSGTSHTIKQNGVDRISYTSSFNQTATKHGLRASAGLTARFDDFSVAA